MNVFLKSPHPPPPQIKKKIKKKPKNKKNSSIIKSISVWNIDSNSYCFAFITLYAVPVRKQWSYCSLALSHRYNRKPKTPLYMSDVLSPKEISIDYKLHPFKAAVTIHPCPKYNIVLVFVYLSSGAPGWIYYIWDPNVTRSTAGYVFICYAK